MAEASTITRFGIMRHAETVWNKEKRIQGQQDSPLTDAGVECARRWGERLREFQWDRILTSDLGRTQRTAALLNESLSLPVESDPRLREKAWGEWEGRSFREIEAEDPGFVDDLEKQGWRFRPPGGEDRGEVWARGREALLDAARRWPGERILTVIHGGVIKCIVFGVQQWSFTANACTIIPRHVHMIAAGDGLAMEAINAISLNGVK